MDLRIRRVCVVGLGITGAAVAETLLAEGAEVVVSDAEDSPLLVDRAEAIRKKGGLVELGRHELKVLEGCDLVIPSKGVPPSNPLIAAALESGVTVWSEFELAFRLMDRVPDSRVFAVTGTNGKTTTTTLLTEILKDAGLPAVAAGNMPTPLVDAVRLAEGESGTIFVCEASSFGLAFIENFHAQVGIVLNVADDHYDWHTGYEDYLASKARITETQTGEDLLGFCVTDRGASEIARRSKARLAAFSALPLDEVRRHATESGLTTVAAGGLSEDLLSIEWEGEDLDIVSTADIRLRGRHNIDNVLAASIAGLEMGIDVSVIAETVSKFEGLPHRMTFVRDKDGVRFIDDSKSTNPHSTLSAMRGLERVVLIAGGLDRSLDFSELSGLQSKLSALVVMGQTGDQVAAVFSGVPTKHAGSVEEAVELAAGMAQPGDVVLLSPGSASWDQYSSYTERGERFAKAVMKL